MNTVAAWANRTMYGIDATAATVLDLTGWAGALAYDHGVPTGFFRHGGTVVRLEVDSVTPTTGPLPLVDGRPPPRRRSSRG